MAARIERRAFLRGGAVGALALMLPPARVAEALAAEPACAVGLEHKRATVRALAATVIPGPPVHDAPGALEAGIDGPLLDALEGWSPPVPIADLLVVALDRHALVAEPGTTFACLSPEGRERALRALEASPSENERMLSLLGVVLAQMLFYGEVGGETSWPSIGYPADVEGWSPAQLACADGSA